VPAKVWLVSGTAGATTMCGARELLSAIAACIAAPKSPPPALLWPTEPAAPLSANSSEIAALAAAAAAAASLDNPWAIIPTLELAFAFAPALADVLRRTLRRGAAVAPEDEAEEVAEAIASFSSSPALFSSPLPVLSLCVKPAWALVRRLDLAWPLLPPRPLPALALAALLPVAEPLCILSICTLSISARGAEKWHVAGASVQRCAFEFECVRACRSMPCSLSKPRSHCVHTNGVEDDADDADEEEEADEAAAEVREADDVKLGIEVEEEDPDKSGWSRWAWTLCAATS
jgi:hypothetical protein